MKIGDVSYLHEIGILCLILIATTTISHFFTRFKIPAVVGQLLIGILLGPALIGWIQPSEFISLFSEIGVIILMFTAGLESNLSLLKKYFKPSLMVAILGVVFPVAAIYLFSLLFHIGQSESIFIGVIFAATSVSISVAVLKELNGLTGKVGATILGAAVVDDVLAVVILSVMTSLGSNQAGTGLLLKSVEQIAYFIAIYFIVKFCAPFIAKLGLKLFVPMSETIVALILCFGMAYIADLVGLSSVVGAFFAGIAISQTRVKNLVKQSIEPIGEAIFIPVFFVSIGLSISFNGLVGQIGFILILTILAILTKLLGAGMGAKLSGYTLPESYIVGAGMVSRGEMALIIAQIGFESKLIGSTYYASIITVIILTTIVAPFLLKHAFSIQKRSINPTQK